MLEALGRSVTLLDGDAVRRGPSRHLGFSRTDRDEHVLRVGYLACEIVRNGGIAICALISPYRATRDRVRAIIGPDWFFEVFVDAPLAVCEQRDPKGLYRRARRGELGGFTGIDDPYEPPLTPAVRLDTTSRSPAENAARTVDALVAGGLVHRAVPPLDLGRRSG